jgi:hypothetical protein
MRSFAVTVTDVKENRCSSKPFARALIKRVASRDSVKA